MIIRESTGGPPGEESLCRRAEEIMAETIAAPLVIAGLATRLRVSPTTLKRAFRRTYADGVAGRYLDIRLDTAKGFLAAGTKVEAVAGMVGFASSSAFHRAFLKHTGKTPGDFATNAAARGALRSVSA